MPVELTREHLRYMNLGERYWRASKDELTSWQRDATDSYFSGLEEWIRKGVGLFLWGDNGVGKSFISAVLCKEVWSKYRVTSYCITAAELKSSWITPCPAHEGSNELMAERAELARFLVIDDLGKEYRTESEFAQSMLGSLLRLRSKSQKTTVITSNLLPEDFLKVYGVSIAQLIKECMIPLELKGKNVRDILAKKIADRVAI